jgi:hypothetical protein
LGEVSAVNIVKEYPGMQNLLARAAQSLGFAEFQRNLLSNLRFCDRLLREMHQDDQIPDNVRTEVYTTLLSPGPGGVLAFSWLVEHESTRELLLKNYLDCLPAGPPRTDALEERHAIEAARIILLHSSIPDSEVLRACAQFLSCNALSLPARQGLFRWLLEQWADHPDKVRCLARWATGEPVDDSLPAAGEELMRAGYLARYKQGEPVDHLLDRLLQQNPQAVAESGLDLLETQLTRILPERRQQLLEQARNHSEARVRRRAYQLGESSEGESFLRLGLRDLDAGVRAWVITRVTQLQRSERPRREAPLQRVI